MPAQDDAHDVWVDAVSHEAVDRSAHGYRSFYAGKHYHFTSKANKQTFDQDPQLWVPTAHASYTSSHLSTEDEPQ